MEHDIALSRPKASEGLVDLVKEGAHSALYSAIQSPLDGVTQMADRVLNTSIMPSVQLIEAPTQSEFGSATWHAQQVGGAVGMILPYMAAAKVTHGAFAEAGLKAESAMGMGNMSLLSKGGAIAVAEGATSGFLYEFAGRASDPQADFWSSRLKHGAVGGLTFGTLSAGTIGIKSLASSLANPTVESIAATASEIAANKSKSVAANMGVAGLAGVPAGVISAESESLLSKGRFASAKELAESAYTMAFVGGALGGVHGLAGKDKVRAREIEDSREVNETIERAAVRRSVQVDILSMRELAEKGDFEALHKYIETYYPELQKAFPLPGEIESKQTYIEYLSDPKSTWEMEQLRAKDGTVNGGLQYQVLEVGGEKIKNAGWLEHIWVRDGNRGEGHGTTLLDHVQSQIKKKGGDVTFWEFNNPDKMTAEEIAEDAKGGITTQDRVDYWANRGAYVLKVPSTGEIAEYAQPGMDGQEPVTYLSTAWNAPGGLDGVKLSMADYKKTLLAAHSTIADVETDPTVRNYLEVLDALPDTHLEFVRLSDYLAERVKALETDTSAVAQARRDRWSGIDYGRNTILLDVDGVRNSNLEVVKAQAYQEKAAQNSPWVRGGQVQHFDSLKGKQNADVVIIGGGIVGLQTAHELGAHGIKTVLLERGLVASGTTRFMGAMGTYVPDSGFSAIHEAYGSEGFTTRLQALMRAREGVKFLAQKYTGDWRPVDSYNVSYVENDAALKAEQELLHAHGDVSPQFITGDAASKIFAPAKSALVFPQEGNLNPFSLSVGLANSGKFRVHENSPVLGVGLGSPEGGVDVFTPEGQIHAAKVVFATNGPPKIFDYLDPHLVPVQTFTRVSDIGTKLAGNFFDTDPMAFTYWRQFGLDGFGPTETLIGGKARFLNKESAAPTAHGLAPRIQELFNGAESRDPMTALIFTAYSDGLPVAGPHPKYKDLWVATGGGGGGLVNGNLIGRTIREQLQVPGAENLIGAERFN